MILRKTLLCLLYMAILGLLCFPAGRWLARLPLEPERAPFRCFAWEQKIFRALRVRAWQKRVPDVSRMFPGAIPAKTTGGRPDTGALHRLIRENCVAELTHWLLCAAGLILLRLWPGEGVICAYTAYVLLGNLPFIIIQRFNRPRLCKAQAIQQHREGREHGACLDPQLE
jgi:glycosyl-4,4'-diaponeurosporenoate acyltransferase